MIVFLYIANCIYLVSYGVRDVLLLRILAVIAMFVFMPYYFYYLDRPMTEPILWNLAFIVINMIWIVKIILERRPPRVTPDQRKLYELAFRGCTPREMLQLLQGATWKDVPRGTLLVTEGAVCSDLMVLHSGTVSVRRRGKELVRLRDGDFVGETSFLTSEPSATSAVVDSASVRYVVWDRHELESQLERRVDLKSAMNAVVGNNLIHKLSAAENRMPELSILADTTAP